MSQSIQCFDFQKAFSPNDSKETAHIGQERKSFEGLVTGESWGEGIENSKKEKLIFAKTECY